MTERKNGRRLVIAFFEDRLAGFAAARELTGEASSQGRRGEVALLSFDETGRPEVTRLGGGAGDDPPGIGTVLGVIASAVLGGVMPPRRHFFDSRSDLTTDDIARIGAELEAGHTAVAVLERRPRAERVVVRLAGMGGKTEIHRLTRLALRQAAETPGLAS